MHVIAAVMPSRHGILTESPPSGPPLPQDLPRTSNQLVSHLQGHKQKQKKKKKSRNVRPKSPSLNVVLLRQQPPATTAVRPAAGPTVTVPEFTGAFPAVPDSYFHCNVLHPHTSNPWELLYFGAGPEAFCLAVSFSIYLFFFFAHPLPPPPPLLLIMTCLEIISSERLPTDGVKVHMEPPDSAF